MSFLIGPKSTITVALTPSEYANSINLQDLLRAAAIRDAIYTFFIRLKLSITTHASTRDQKWPRFKKLSRPKFLIGAPSIKAYHLWPTGPKISPTSSPPSCCHLLHGRTSDMFFSFGVVRRNIAAVRFFRPV